jgi:hypothetical protein
MLRIATWNLDRPTKRHSRHSGELLQPIKNINADVWVLTETDSSICPGIDYQSVCSAERETFANVTETWVTIWSRLPLTPVGDVWDNQFACCGKIATTTGELILYGMVLPWLGCEEYLPNRGTEAFLHALENQREDWRRLRNLHGDCGICVAGDFNQDLGSKHYYGSNVGKQSLRNTLKQEGMTCLTAGRYDKVAAATNARRACIDHIVISNDWLSRFRGSVQAWPSEQVIDSGLTDHFGMYVDLEI